MRTVLAVTLLLAPAAALAESRVTIGASAGLWQNEEDANAGIESSQTLGLWGRAGLTKRLSGQLEVAEHQAGGCGDFCTSTNLTVRSATALLVVDLKDRGPWMPILMVGLGIDRAEGDFAFPTSGRHIEGGFGIEYRAEGGVTFGVDARLGGRSVDDDDDVVIQGATGRAPILPGPGGGIREGEYRAARMTLGVRF